MNIFYLSHDPVEAAQFQCNAHVPKMIVETAQMLSTAHRVLDGKLVIAKSKSNRNIKYWELDDSREPVLYKPTHVNHPSAVWIRETVDNYEWAYKHFMGLCNEFRHRYGKIHLSELKLASMLAVTPNKLNQKGLTNVPLAMGSNPECIDKSDPVGSYRKFYQTKQERFKMVWTKRPVPEWFEVK